MTEITGTANQHQRTPEWIRERMGRFSCSQLWRLMTEPKSKSEELSKGAITYIMECAAEKLTGLPAKDEFNSRYTDWGVENEPIAKGIYESVFETKVSNTGYIAHGENFGGSPDGLIDADGGIEIKCPYTITQHLYNRMLVDLRSEPEYWFQVVGYLLITKREWFDFVSYHPSFPAKHQLKRIRIAAKDIDFKPIENKLKIATNKLNQILNDL